MALRDGLDGRYMRNTPFIKTPLIDFGGSFGLQQHNERCATLEMNYLRCAATYGFPRNRSKCYYEYEDFMECLYQYKFKKRIRFMEHVADKKYQAGLLDKKRLEAPYTEVYENFDNLAS